MKQLINGWKVTNEIDPSSDLVLVFNLTDEKLIENYGVSFKITKNGFETRVGLWQPKCIHDWKTDFVKQYQQCRKCGKGHAL